MKYFVPLYKDCSVPLFNYYLNGKITRWLLFRKFMTPVLLLVSLIIIGTIGYVLIDHYTWINALYMAVITIGTVGFGEIQPLSNAGKLFTIFLILASLATVAFYITMITRLLIDGEWRKQYQAYRQNKKLRAMKKHVIVCGYGRNGHQACEVLRQNKIPFAVIEQRQHYLSSINETDLLVVQGDATKDETLLEAGVMDAYALISALPNDSDNLFVVLTARQLNPNLIIISRASDMHTIKKLKIAGATNVIMPDKLGGAHMASLTMIPDVHELLSMLTTIHTDEFRVSEVKIAQPLNLGDMNIWKQTGCTVLGIKRADGSYEANPQPSSHVAPGERLIVMGSKVNIANARKLVEATK
jgi:voltage-gated potassium channel